MLMAKHAKYALRSPGISQIADFSFAVSAFKASAAPYLLTREYHVVSTMLPTSLATRAIGAGNLTFIVKFEAGLQIQ